MADCTPFWDEGDTLTCHASAAVIGCRFVSISGPRVDGNPAVAHTGAGADSFGVAARDKAIGEKVIVHRARTIVAPVEVGATPVVAAGLVMSDAVGRCVPYVAGTGVLPLGRALDDAPVGGFAIIDRTARG